MTGTNSLPGWLKWTGYFAWVFLALIAIAVLTVRSGSWQQGLLLYAAACLVSALLLLVFAITFLLPRFSDRRGAIAARALPAIPGVALLVTGLLGSQDIPPIHDITTDLDNPPRFEAVAELRGKDSNPLEVKPEVIEMQEAAYPDLGTLQTGLSYEDAFAKSAAIARELGWEIVREDVNAGYIEASDTTPIMNFTDDVVIRIQTNANGTAVDLRSVSRVGVSDLGANAERIRAFAERFRTAS